MAKFFETIRQLVEDERYVVVVEVGMVVPVDDPSEPCYESETVQFLKKVQQQVDADNEEWLRRHGKVYAVLGAV